MDDHAPPTRNPLAIVPLFLRAEEYYSYPAAKKPPVVLALSLAVSVLGAGCMVGPNYKRPVSETPPVFAENAPWKVAAPKETLPRGEWWKIFGDAGLDALEKQATAASPTIRAALARSDQARAVARVSRSDYFPQIGIDPSGSRARYSANRQIQTPATRLAYTTDSYNVPLDLTYEIDLWGRLRRALESARALAEASEAAYHTVLLGVQADVAQTYFNLCALATERTIVEHSIDTRRQTLELARTRFAGGASGELDVLRAETELANAEGDALALDERRDTLRHALAVLCGATPESFSPSLANSVPLPPVVPIGLPSELLERRPDVAQAERTLAAVNAQIGIAKAAFFPSIRLVGSAGFNSDELSTIFSWDSRQWSLGPSISLPLFQGGRLRANYERAQAAYDEAVSNYRQRVLVAFQDVEDSLGTLRSLDQQIAVSARAVRSSREAADVSTVRYEAGLVTSLEVIDAERTALQNERQAAQLRARQLGSTILLVRALGGGW